MDEIKKLTNLEFSDIASKYPFNRPLLGKDYYITVILFLLRDVKGIYFKGGTALQKIFLNHARLSEDIDFTISDGLKTVKEKIVNVLNNSGFFEGITKDKDAEGFTRLVVHYIGFSDEKGEVYIDLNRRARLETKPERHKIRHFYPEHLPAFSLNTLSEEELIAEKVASSIGRNKPRDHYDIYQIIQHKLPIKMKLVEKKCKFSEDEFNIIKMFNNAKKLKNRWDEDMIPLIAEEVSFQEVMQTLAKHFKLKEEKDKMRK